MTIQEYATSRSITYEAARQAVERCKPDILEHITKHKRTRILDDAAVKILDDNRRGSSVSVIKKKATEKADQIDRLKDEIILRDNKIIQLQNELAAVKDKLSEKALESSQTLLRLESANDTNKRLESEIDRIQSEIQAYRPFCFGLYRKKKIKPSAEVSHEEKYIFPENWEENYIRWKNQEITTDEFIDRSGVEHRGTFYNMLKAYKKQLES